MCGLVGIINREQYKFTSDKLIKYFNQALFTDTLRGKHGTGVSAVNPKGSIISYKKAMTAPDFLDLQFAQRIIGNESNVFLSGHNRWATQGSHTDENSHPFKHNHITMFHNGTLDNHVDLPNGKDFDVDSDAIAHSLSKIGTIKTLESLEGAYALVWYDSDIECINFARNDERPLWFGYIKDSTSAIYASEKGMLQWLASRNNLQLNKIEELQTGKHVQVFLDENKKTTITPFKPKETNWGSYYGGGCYVPPKNSGPKTGIILSSGGLSTNTQIEVDIKSFTKYNSSSSTYGLLTGVCSKDMLARKIIFNGISELESKRYVGKTVTGDITKLLTDTVTFNNIKIKQATSLTVVQNETLILKNEEAAEGTRVGPRSILIPQSEFDTLTKHGCVVCTCNIIDEEDSLIHWDSQNNPYCEDCALELYA